MERALEAQQLRGSQRLRRRTKDPKRKVWRIMSYSSTCPTSPSSKQTSLSTSTWSSQAPANTKSSSSTHQQPHPPPSNLTRMETKSDTTLPVASMRKETHLVSKWKMCKGSCSMAPRKKCQLTSRIARILNDRHASHPV